MAGLGADDAPLDAPGTPPGTLPDLPPGTPPGPPPDAPLDARSDASFDERVADFYSPGVPLSGVRPRPRATAVPADLLLRILEPPPVRVRHIPLVDLLRKPYRELGGGD